MTDQETPPPAPQDYSPPAPLEYLSPGPRRKKRFEIAMLMAIVEGTIAGIATGSSGCFAFILVPFFALGCPFHICNWSDRKPILVGLTFAFMMSSTLTVTGCWADSHWRWNPMTATDIFVDAVKTFGFYFAITAALSLPASVSMEVTY